MSIASMTRMAAQAEVERQANAGGAARRGPTPAGGEVPPPTPPPSPPPEVGGATITSSSDPQSGAQAALEAIAAYIPSEALALYLAALGFFQPTSIGAKTLWLVIGVIFVIGLVILGALDRKTRPPRNKTIIVMILGIVSFLVYSAALPTSPFSELHAQATIAAGFIALVMASFLPRIAGLLGVAPSKA